MPATTLNPRNQIRTAASYAWSATPGGSLTGGSPATVTLSTVPAGVYGSNTGSTHYLYISGGTGTPEVVAITGGTATPGATNGTITFTPANSHSGAWTIGSATAGIQEAIYSLPLDVAYGAYHTGTVHIPDGDFTLYAGVVVHLQEVAICGASRAGTRLNFASTIPNAAFYFTCGSQAVPDKGRIGLYGLTIVNSSTTQDTIVFDGYSGTGGGSPVAASDLIIYGGSKGLYVKQSQAISFRDLIITDCAYGVYADVSLASGECRFDNIIINSINKPTSVGFYEVATSNASLPGTVFANNVSFYGTFSVGLKIESTAGRQSVYFIGTNIVVDGVQNTAGIHLKSASNCYFANVWVANSSTVEAYGVLVNDSSLCTFINGVYGKNDVTGGGGDIAITGSSDAITVSGVANAAYRALRMLDGTSTGLMVNLRFNDITHAIDPTEFANYLAATQVSGLTGPIKCFFGSSTLNDWILTNIESGATTPTKSISVDSHGRLNVYNAAHNAIVWGLADSGIQTKRIGASVSSGATIAPTGPIFHVTGTTTINTITVPNDLTSGTICIIPDGVFSTGLTGNIAIASTSVVGKALFMTYDAGTSKWYPSY